MRMLDNVIDINYYAVKKARDSNLRHRPVGLGIMGFQDALYELRMPYASRAGGRVRRPLDGSGLLPRLLGLDRAGAERGRYSSYRGSLWDRGILPLDTLDLLAEQRGGYVEVDRSATLDWDALRAAHRRSTACATPTAWRSRRPRPSPTSSASTRRSSRASATCRSSPTCRASSPIVNEYLVRDLKKLGLWDDVMVMDLKHFDGSLRRIDRVPRGPEGAVRHRLRGRDRSGWSKPRRAARSGSTRRSRSTSTWPARRARSSTRPTSSRGCAA